MENAKELYCEAVVPVIIGNGASAHALALRLTLRHGLSAVLCGKRRSVLDLLDVVCGFLRLCEDDDRLALEQLVDFSERWNERTLVLIPATDVGRRLVAEHRDCLECRYLISEDGRIDELPLRAPERWVCSENE